MSCLYLQSIKWMFNVREHRIAVSPAVVPVLEVAATESLIDPKFPPAVKLQVSESNQNVECSTCHSYGSQDNHSFVM